MDPRNLTLIAILMITVLTVVPGQAAHLEAGPCALGFEPDGFHRFTASGADSIVLEFHLDQPVSGFFYYALAFAIEETPEFPTGLREGAMAGRIVETDAGEIISKAATRVFRAGPHAKLDPGDLEIAPSPEGFCGFIASGGHLTLGPGAYRMVVPGTAEHGSERGALIPGAVENVDFRVVNTRDLPADEDCQLGAGADAAFVGANVVLACDHQSTAGPDQRGYWLLNADRTAGKDPLREAQWSTPAGPTEPVARFLLGSAGEGEYRLRVPHWIGINTPQTPWLPPGTTPADPGLDGVFVIV